MTVTHHTSVTRIADDLGGDVCALPRSSWAMGDYVVGEVVDCHGHGIKVELADGRMIDVADGDRMIGAWGDRFATLEATGTWTAIGDDGLFHALTGAGLFGKLTSKSPFLAMPIQLRYVGHLVKDGRKRTMAEHARSGTRPFIRPVVLIVGSSMSSGKTLSARQIVRVLKAQGHSVVGAKLTGAGRYRDALSMRDAGADHIVDFMDAGLPSTVVEPALYRERMAPLLRAIEDLGPDVVVVEAGASPLEPYNGEAAWQMLRPFVRLSVLCASDPYAVVGISQAFDLQPDLVTGPCANTDGGIALVEQLSGVRPVRLMGQEGRDAIADLVRARFGTGQTGAGA